MNKKPKEGFRKVRKLITILRKCNGKAVVGEGALISPAAAKVLLYCALVILAGALFAGAYFVQPYISGLIPAGSLARSLMLLLLILSFVLSIKDIVTVLYTADDIEILLPMPFSAAQIVTAKLIIVASFPVAVSLIVLNSVCLGYGIRAGVNAPFIIGIILSSILIPFTGVFTGALLVVIIFRVFGFIRNRDITVALGGIFTFGLSVAYIYFSNRFSGGNAAQTTAVFNAFSSVSAAFPNIFFMSRFMDAGSIPGLLISIGITVLVIVLALLAVRAFYFKTALSMQITGGGKKSVSKDALRSIRKNSVLRSLTAYEAKSARRNPAFMIYGFAISFLWPVLFALSLFLRNDSLIGGISVPLDTVSALLASVSFAIMASCFACGFNVLPGTAFSREGSTFEAIRALPVDLKDYCRSKRNYPLILCSLGSVLYVIILGIVCVAAGFIPVRSSWVIPLGACVSFLLNVAFIDLMILRDSRKPRLHWESETEFSRKLVLVNIILIVIGTVMLMIFALALTVLPTLGSPQVTRIIVIVCAAVPASILVLALLVNRFSLTAAAGNLKKFES